jgi:hypothetical protein
MRGGRHAPLVAAQVAVQVAALIASLVAFAGSSAAETSRAHVSGDPLESADCRHALTTLDAHEAKVASAARASGASVASSAAAVSLAAARRNATVACLATHADPAQAPQRFVRPAPVAVAPLAVAPASAPPALSGRAAPPAPVARPPERPYAITSCDAGGCWANDGSRLNRIGPNLVGPRGLCTVQGTLVQCP